MLDRIADSVNPTLGLLAVALPWLRPYRQPPLTAWRRVGGALLCVGLAYAGQAFDNFTGLWPLLSLDYSGHSAVCVAWLVSIAHLSYRWAVGAIAVGCMYAALMMYQQYHTFADIVTTAVPVGFASEAVWRWMVKR